MAAASLPQIASSLVVVLTAAEGEEEVAATACEVVAVVEAAPAEVPFVRWREGHLHRRTEGGLVAVEKILTRAKEIRSTATSAAAMRAAIVRTTDWASRHQVCHCPARRETVAGGGRVEKHCVGDNVPLAAAPLRRLLLRQSSEAPVVLASAGDAANHQRDANSAVLAITIGTVATAGAATAHVEVAAAVGAVVVAAAVIIVCENIAAIACVLAVMAKGFTGACGG